MADSAGPGLGDIFSLIGGNPLAGLSKSFTQFQQGVSLFMESVERFNETMEQLNGVASRLNGLLDTVEEPMKALAPQVTRTVKTADALVQQLSGPLERLAPAMIGFTEVVTSPVVAGLPRELDAVLRALGDVAQRLQPLGQLAESAGGWLGLRPLAALRGNGTNPGAAQGSRSAPGADMPPGTRSSTGSKASSGGRRPAPGRSSGNARASSGGSARAQPRGATPSDGRTVSKGRPDPAKNDRRRAGSGTQPPRRRP